MKYLSILLCACCLYGCEPESVSVVPTEPESSVTPTVGSFRMRNAEMHAEMLVAMEKHELTFWVNDDGSIGYNLADGELIDTIGNEIILAYIARN